MGESRRSRILLLDDDPGDRALAARLLEQELDAEVAPVGDGVAFASHLARGGFDAVVCELHLSWGDLAEALEVLRRHRGDVPVVLLTRQADLTALEQVYGRRVEALVAKTSDGFLRLPRVVGELLEQTPRSRRGSQALLRDPEVEAPVASRESDRFQEIVHTLSHDLQDPLQLVVRYGKLLGELEADREAEWKGHRYLEHIMGSAERMQAMIDGMLEYSRLDSPGESEETVQLTEAAEAALANLRGLIEESGAEVTLEILPSIPGDFQQMVVLFQNLVANAIKFRSDDPPRIHVGKEEEKDAWVVFVRDNGIGIPPEHHERIFGLFRRLHPEGRYPGSGMGLAICKRIVERHGGEIWVDSSPGEGTTFRVRLPRVRKPANPRHRSREEAGHV